MKKSQCDLSQTYCLASFGLASFRCSAWHFSFIVFGILRRICFRQSKPLRTNCRRCCKEWVVVERGIYREISALSTVYCDCRKQITISTYSLVTDSEVVPAAKDLKCCSQIAFSSGDVDWPELLMQFPSWLHSEFLQVFRHSMEQFGP